MFWLLITIIAALALAYRRASMRTAVAVLGGLLVAYGLLGNSLGLFILLAVAGLALSTLLLVKALRQEWLSRPLLNAFRHDIETLPTEVLDWLQTGESGWDAALFSGTPDWASLRAIQPPSPPSTATAETTPDDAVTKACTALAHDPADVAAADCLLAAVTAIDSAPVFRASVSAYAGALMAGEAWKLLGPPRMAWLQLLREDIASGRNRKWVDKAALKRDVFAVAETGFAPETLHCGWIHILPTNPYGKDGSADELCLRLTLATGVRASHAAEYYAMLVIFEGNGDKSPSGSTCIVVPADTQGLQVDVADADGVLLRGHAMSLPISAIVGGTYQIGRGASRLAQAIARVETQYAPGLRLGSALPLALFAAARARLHPPFIPPITQHRPVRRKLAVNAAGLYAADALRQLALSVLDNGATSHTLTAIAEAQTSAVTEWVHQNHYGRGGAFAILAERPPLPSMSALAPVQLGLRILGRCHPYLGKELAAATGPEAADTMADFDEALWAHIGHIQSNAARSLLAACGAGKILLPSNGLPPSAARCLRRIDRASANLAFLVDLALFSLRGKALKNDALVAVVGEAVGQLLRASAAVWLTQTEKVTDRIQMSIMRIAVTDALDTVHGHFEDLIRELPKRWQRCLARCLVIPFGHWRTPHREEDFESASQWLCNGAAMRHFAPLLPTNLPEPALRLRRALEATLAGEPLVERLCKATTSNDPLECIDQVVKAEQIDSAQTNQLMEWLALCEDIERRKPLDPRFTKGDARRASEQS